LIGIKFLRAINSYRGFRNRTVASQLRAAINFVHNDIPCFVICFNNLGHVQSTVQQLNKYGITPIIFDNCSTCKDTQGFLTTLHMQTAYVVWVGKNLGHKVGFMPGIYEAMPNIFGYTDPDLLFSKTMPSDFLNVLATVADQYRVFKAGMALSLDAGLLNEKLSIRFEKKSSMPYSHTFSVRQWESQYWKFPLKRDDDLVVYAAGVDTTFAVYRKSNYSGKFTDAVRIAGNFTAIHMPWFINFDTMTECHKARYLKGNKSTTWR
jgi:hypothetical protein